MSFDGFFMHHINEELKDKLSNGRINKIYQPSPYEIVLLLRANRQNYKLFFSIHPMQARYHLTKETFFNPEMAPNFCMVLRKHLEGALLKDIQQVGLDRISTFIFANHDELGDSKLYHLTVELMGKHSNLFLIHPQSNVIIDCLKHIPTTKNGYRAIRPNAYYQLPPYQQKVNVFALSNTEIETICQTLDTTDLQQTFQGIGASTRHWLLRGHSVLQGEQLAKRLIALKNEPHQATLCQHNFLPIAIDQGKIFPTLSELLDVFYAEKSKFERVQQLSGNLIAQLKQVHQKNELKLAKLQQEQVQAQQADSLRIKGELLTTYAFQVEKGSNTITLPNYYDNEAPIQISLDTTKSATQNAQSYFKKYQKQKQALTYLTEQIDKAQQENAYLDSVLVQIQLAETEDLLAIREELVAMGYVKVKQRMKRKQQAVKLKPLIFQTSDGVRILVGRNNLQNDELTLKTAKKDDIWLHAKDIPGSHVIIQHHDPSEETLIEGAMIAAYYSKYQQSANIPVDYVAIKHIKKPNGAKPGFVIYENQKTLYVSPSKEIVDNLRV